MNTRIFISALSLIAASLGATSALAYPVDPAKVPVNLSQYPDATNDFTLAYDTINPNVVYYAPKSGRTATLNGQPLIGFATLPNGEGFFNAQLQFGVFGADRTRLLGAIAAAGKSAVIFPYRRTKVIPLVPGIDPETGQEFCETINDPSTGETYEECSGTIYKELLFSTKGPSLGENVAITGSLKPMGAAIYRTFLGSGNALQVLLDAEYYAAGVAFEATVTVSYDKLFENFRSYSSFHGFLCTDIQVETFFKNETICADRDPSECGVFIRYTNLLNGQTVGTGEIDPDDVETQRNVAQAAERLAQRLRDEMLTPVSQALGPLDMSRPNGFKLDAKYERQKKGLNATFTFRSPNSVNVKTTTLPVSMGCVEMTDQGRFNRILNGDCALYWQ